MKRIIQKLRQQRLRLRLVALLTAVMGIVNLFSAVTPSLPDRRDWLELFLPFYVRSGGRIFAALAGFVLLVLASNLLRRKRVAWYLTIGLLIISIVSHLIKGLDYEECILAAIVLGQLVLMRSTFTADSDRPSMRQGVNVLCGAILFTLAYGTAGFYLLDGRFNVAGSPTNFGLIASIKQTLAMFFMEDAAGLAPKGRFATFFANSIYSVGSITLLFALFMLLRPVLLKTDSSHDRHRARVIIDQYGESSLARLALLPDKSYYFSPSGESTIAYVAKGRAAIALGDPIGPIADRHATLVAFSQFCERNDWFPVFYEAVPGELSRYQELGFRSIQIGEEAIVDLTTFTLKGKANQNLRTAINRLQKTGHRFELHQPPMSDALLHQLKGVSDNWLAHKQGSEKQFSIAWFDPDHLRPCAIGVIYNSDGKVIAFSNVLSDYNRSEVTVDLMRHVQHVEPGTMDFLFVSMMQHFQGLGYAGFNFSLSPLAGVGRSAQAGKVEKGLQYLFEHLNQFYNFQGLHQFKDKFKPRWEPRYLVYPSWANLPDVVVGLVRADSGDRLLDYLKLGG